jgi:hypothetical protein
MHRQEKEKKMGALLRKAALLAAAYLVIQSIPDIARYIRMRRM